MELMSAAQMRHGGLQSLQAQVIERLGIMQVKTEMVGYLPRYSRQLSFFCGCFILFLTEDR